MCCHTCFVLEGCVEKGSFLSQKTSTDISKETNKDTYPVVIILFKISDCRKRVKTILQSEMVAGNRL